jgi:hypothetical protein
MKTRISIITAALFAAFVSTASAGPNTYGGWTGYLDNRVTTKQAAEDCCKEKDVKVALVCKDCKSAEEKPGTEKKGIMGWFKADSTHDCSGCGGKITVKGPSEKGGPAGTYQHVCSKCGDKSAIICSSHKKA